jgi:hypothetical protein
MFLKRIKATYGGANMKKISILFVLCLMVLGLTACGRPARPGKLAREARKTYGSAKVVSKVKTPIGYSVTMHDKLQDFDYTIYSYREVIGLFNYRGEISDTFKASLVQKIIYDEKIAVDDLKDRYDATIDVGGSINYVYSANPDKAKQAAIEFADILQRNNLEGRLDYVEITALTLGTYLSERTGFKPDHDEEVGRITLPDKTWKSKEDELIELYTIYAREIDPSAIYLRKEVKKLKFTQYDLKDIGGSNGAPNYWSSPVTFYYFKAFDGGEFYMGDFYLKNPNDPTTIDMVNNYAQRTYPDD